MYMKVYLQLIATVRDYTETLATLLDNLSLFPFFYTLPLHPNQ